MNRTSMLTVSARLAGFAAASLLTMVLSLCAASALAVTTTWTGGAGNDLWDDPDNWDMGAPAVGVTSIANIVGSSGAPVDVDLNGTQNIAGITLNTTWTNFSGGVLNQNRNTSAAFTATDTFLAADANFQNAGSINWTRVTRPNGDRDLAWNPGNGAQIVLNSVGSDTGGSYSAAHWNSTNAFDAVADNTKWNNWNLNGNPTGSNTGSLTLQNGAVWTADSSWSTGMGAGLFTVTINDSELKLNTSGSPVFGPNTKLVTDNGLITVGTANRTFDLRINNPADFDGDGLTINMTGVTGASGTIEVASEDIGPWLDGFEINDGNFSFDRLELGNTFGSIFLRDDIDNSLGSSTVEAIYVRELVAVSRIGNTAGEGLDLRGINLYYQTAIGDLGLLNVMDSVGGGALIQVTEFMPAPIIPEPSTLVLAGLGMLLLSRRRRRRG